MGKIYVNQVGVSVELKTGNDLTRFTTVGIAYHKPDGTNGIWAGVKDGTKIIYTTTVDDLPIRGAYSIQALVSNATCSGLGETVVIDVYPIWG